MSADFLLLTTRLRTIRAVGILTLPSAMARFPTEVGATFEYFPTDIAATDVSEPAWLVLQSFLAAHAPLLAQEGAFRTWVVVLMTIVGNLWMTASFWSLASVPTRGRLCTAGKRRLKDCPATVAIDLLKDCLSARSAGTLMAQLLANVVAALERSPALASANVLCFKTVINRASSRMERSLLFLRRLTLNSFALTRAATLFTPMPATVEIGSTDASTLWLFFMALMANGR